MKVVYAVKTVNVGIGGNTFPVLYGTHWPANDPVVQKYPDLFSEDPKYGLFATTAPVEEVVAEKPAELVTREEPKRGPGRPKSGAK